MGIEPTALAWEARVLPLYDARAGPHSTRVSGDLANAWLGEVATKVDALGKSLLASPPLGGGSKSVIYEPGEAAEFLGVDLVRYCGSYRVEIAQKQIEKIREELLQFGSVKDWPTAKSRFLN